MSYRGLYDYSQTLAIPIKRNAIKAKVEELCSEPLTYIRAGLDPAILLGKFVRATNKDDQFVKQCGGANVVVIARGLDPSWERLVLFKEMMHMFDSPLECTNSSAEFERLILDFCASELTEFTPQFKSEVECFWRAIAVLCPEQVRVTLQQQRVSGTITDAQISGQLRVPEKYVPAFFHPQYKETITRILA
jgi:hypothetical protein